VDFRRQGLLPDRAGRRGRRANRRHARHAASQQRQRRVFGRASRGACAARTFRRHRHSDRDYRRAGEEPRRISDGAALWTKPKSDISAEDYNDFYRQLAGQFDEPALTIHWRAEGRTEYTVLAFIPGSRPLDLFDPVRKSKSKLYVRRVLISKEVDLLPAWLRFVRLVVDSADIPLNVSREMAQQSPILGQIGKAIATRIIQELSKLAENEPEKFAGVWENSAPC